LITFLTHFSYGGTARALDDRRLGNQRIEAWEVFDGLTGGEIIFPGHPVYKMWDGYQFALGIYGMMLCMEWISHRGCGDKIFWKFKHAIDEIRDDDPSFTYEQPPWLHDTAVLRSHRSNLIRKQQEGDVSGRDYKKMFKGTPLLMPYIWPIILDDGCYELRISKSEKQRLKEGHRALPRDIASRIANL
jgi:hypothetical protein